MSIELFKVVYPRLKDKPVFKNSDKDIYVERDFIEILKGIERGLPGYNPNLSHNFGVLAEYPARHVGHRDVIVLYPRAGEVYV